MAMQDKTRRHDTGHDNTRQDCTRQDCTKQDKTKHVYTIQYNIRQDKAGQNITI